MKREEQASKIQKISAKAWMDARFKQSLLSDATKRLKEEGVEIPSGIEVRIVEDTDIVHHLVLPVNPSNGQLSEEQLANVAGGAIDYFLQLDGVDVGTADSRKPAVTSISQPSGKTYSTTLRKTI